MRTMTLRTRTTIAMMFVVGLTALTLEMSTSPVGAGLGLLCTLGVAVLAARFVTRPLGPLTAGMNAPAKDVRASLEHSHFGVRDLTDAFAGIRQSSSTKATELLESEQRLRQLIESLPQLVWTCTPQGELDYVGPHWVAYTGKEAASQFGQEWLEQVHAEDRERVKAVWRAATAVGRECRAEFRLRRYDGVYRWFDTHVIPLRESNGAISHWFGTNIDIEEKWQLLHSLRDSEERLRTVIQNMAEGLVICDAAGHLQHWNTAFARMHGVSDASEMGSWAQAEHAIEVSTLDGKRLHTEEWPLARILRGNTLRNLEVRVRHIEKQWQRTFSCSGAMVALSHAEPLAFMTVTDVTRSKAAEQALRDSQTQLETVIEALDQGLVITNPAGAVIRVNRATEEMYGYRSLEEALSADEHATETFEIATLEGEVIPPEQWPLSRILRGERLHNVELRIRKRDADWSRIHKYGGTLARAENGRPLLAFMTISDITDTKQAEESLRRTQRLESLGTLAGGIAHDFNNLLLAITGNVRLLRQDLPPDHAAHTELQQIEQASARAADLVRGILQFSRQQKPTRETIRLGPVVKDAAKLLRSTLPAMLELECRIASDVPSVNADASQIQQVLMNLVTNAAHAIAVSSERETGRVDIEVDAQTIDEPLRSGLRVVPRGLYARLSVSDTGCGMDEATLTRVFDPFFTTKPPGHGTGLGLSILHGIVREHGGEIIVHSELHKGTTFTVYLPAAARVLAPTVLASVAPERGDGQHVLYIDDEEPLVILTARVLERLGYRVTGFTDPQEAVRAFRERPTEFDVVVTDLSMPGMSGFAVARAVREIRPDIVVFMTSGYVREPDQEAALRAGIRDVILKPSTVEQLGHALSEVFKSKASDAEATVNRFTQ